MDIRSDLNTARLGADIAAENRIAGQTVKDPNKQRAEVKKLSEDFESLFLNLVMKSMRQTVDKSDLMNGGNAEDVFQDMLDTEYAKQMAGQRMTGLADSIEDFMLRSQGVSDSVGLQKTAETAKGLAAYGMQPARGPLREGENKGTINHSAQHKTDAP